MIGTIDVYTLRNLDRLQVLERGSESYLLTDSGWTAWKWIGMVRTLSFPYLPSLVSSDLRGRIESLLDGVEDGKTCPLDPGN